MKICSALGFALVIVLVLLMASVIFHLVQLGFQQIGLSEDAASGGATVVFVFVGSFIWYLIDN